ncbi:MAG: hypothetical protein Ct9H300mP28_09940 [Pseudomonadota bacterium]|nr:MAG: hypothetical protein Ct9H300mP28_09940 [Pseudomonadota bacterium]
MGGYRLTEGQKNSFYPAILAVISTIVIFITLNYYQLNVKNIRNTEEGIAMIIATFGVLGLLIAVFWSGWRTYRIEDTLKGVMLETSKTTFKGIHNSSWRNHADFSLQGIWGRGTG